MTVLDFLTILSILPVVVYPQPACEYGTVYNGQCECWTGYKGPDCATYDQTIMPNSGSLSAINLGSITYYSTEWTFVDVMKTAMWWVTQRTDSGDWDTGEHHLIPWREDGYPQYLPEETMLLVTLMLRDSAWYPAGRYIVLYEGQGQLDFGFAATVVSRGPGRIELDVVPDSQGVKMELRNVSSNDPVRNVRVIMPGFEKRHELFPFHPTLLEFIRKFSVVRYMDWGLTNNYPENITWADRRQSTYYSQGDGPERRGTAYEYMIHLSNVAGVSPWICTPHAADDGYIRNLATLIRDSLRPDLRVYVEYSNEVWNAQFAQHHYAGQKGIELNFTSPETPWEGAWRYTAYRSVQIFDIFKEVFGEAQRDRLEFILPTQKANPYVTRQIVSFQDAYLHADTIAMTAYFCGYLGNADMRDFVAASTIDQLFDNCTASFPSEQQTFTEQVAVAEEYGLELLTYEAGQHIVAVGYEDEANTAKFIEMNRAGRMQDVMTQWMDMYEATVVQHVINQEFPGGMWAQFSSVAQPSKYGSWGILEYTPQNRDEAPKYLALHTYMNKYVTDYSGPRCSFVDVSGFLAYGCYTLSEGDVYRCYTSADRGQIWQPLPDIPTPSYIYLTLDGVDDTQNQRMYVRAVDSRDVTYYYTIQTGGSTWTSSNEEFYFGSMYNNATLALPPGVTNDLIIEAYDCP